MTATNFAVLVQDAAESKRAQKALFKLGYKWNSNGETKPLYLDAESLWAEADKSICHGSAEYYAIKDVPKITLVELEARAGIQSPGTEAPPYHADLLPRTAVARNRSIDILEAMTRYLKAGKTIPVEWYSELNAVLPMDEAVYDF